MTGKTQPITAPPDKPNCAGGDAAAWVVYILECADRTLYTGITNNLDRRIAAHEAGRGAKYTKGRAPFTLLYTEAHQSRGQATRRETEIKALGREAKRQLAAR